MCIRDSPWVIGGLLLLIAHHQGQQGKIKVGTGALPSFNASSGPLGGNALATVNKPDLSAKGTAISANYQNQIIQAAPYFAGTEAPKLLTESV